ncbi:MAG: VTT domain-containing protein, partial [Patescibacteria group bacterium]
FFKKHGGKTIILARFMPFIRTFAPFVAGIGHMDYGKFISYNVVGGLLWVGLFTFVGYFFGNVEFVKHNFSIVIMVIILISVLPAVVEVVKHKTRKH